LSSKTAGDGRAGPLVYADAEAAAERPRGADRGGRGGGGRGHGGPCRRRVAARSRGARGGSTRVQLLRRRCDWTLVGVHHPRLGAAGDRHGSPFRRRRGAPLVDGRARRVRAYPQQRRAAHHPLRLGAGRLPLSSVRAVADSTPSERSTRPASGSDSTPGSIPRTLCGPSSAQTGTPAAYDMGALSPLTHTPTHGG
jgi:hypothetical protein